LSMEGSRGARESEASLGEGVTVSVADPRERAILRTVTYAALFQFPLALPQLHRRLMDVSLDIASLRRLLDRPFLRARLAVTEGLVHPRGREEWLGLLRQRGERTAQLLAGHRGLLQALCRVPYVRLVALSGACAHGNATDDDVDVFLMVRRGRAWGVTAAIMLASKLLGVRRTLCVNYVLDESAAGLPEHDLVTASEIVGMKPVAGREAYRRFVAANDWVAGFFPNFFGAHVPESADVPEVSAPRWLERLLDLGPAPLLEALARLVLRAWLRRAGDAPGVVLSDRRLKLHLRDHRPVVAEAFAAALREVGDGPTGSWA
jgi:hypothetical protein